MARCILTNEQRWIPINCNFCNKLFKRRRWQPKTKFCSRECYYSSKIGIKRPPMTQEQKDKISLKNTGRIHSKITREKLSIIQKTSMKAKAHRIKLHIKNRGEGHGRWIGGRRYDGNGYVLVYSPNHPNKIQKNYVYEHRLIMEKHIGRFLTQEEQIHHINNIKDDNRIENLKLFKNNSEHMSFHNPKGKKIGYKSK